MHNVTPRRVPCRSLPRLPLRCHDTRTSESSGRPGCTGTCPGGRSTAAARTAAPRTWRPSRRRLSAAHPPCAPGSSAPPAPPPPPAACTQGAFIVQLLQLGDLLTCCEWGIGGLQLRSIRHLLASRYVPSRTRSRQRTPDVKCPQAQGSRRVVHRSGSAAARSSALMTSAAAPAPSPPT